ncbi:MAG: endo-1,4-beta-xylanase [Oscillospiraceae bacterium]|nr:endo-1,4-beta-xylanase [Oscillospiraceae bacterium]
MRKIVASLLICAMLISACEKTPPVVVEEPSSPVINPVLPTVVDGDGEDVEDPAVVNPQDPAPSLVTPPQVGFEVVFAEDFEGGTSAFTARGSETLAIVDDGFQSEKCLVVVDRTAAWNGPKISLTNIVEPGTLYEFRAMIKYDFVPEVTTERLTASLEIGLGGVINYSGEAHVQAVLGEWAEIAGTFSTPENFTSFALYFEGGAEIDGEFCEIYLDDVEIKKVNAEKLPADLLPPIFEVHEDYFSIGVGVVMADLQNSDSAALINHHFNSITMGNEMKPSSLLDRAGSIADPDGAPAIRTAVLDECLSYARDNGLKMRGHTLVWHEQTPLWFFKEGYSQDVNAANVSREVMLARLESYIETVLSYCQENYPGVIYAWDVVNEAIDTASADENKIRDMHAGAPNPWYEVVGADYVEQAFYFARKYAEDDVKLFYNDYNEYHLNKLMPITALLSELKQKDLVDGMGMQAHIGMSDPAVIDFQWAVLQYAELGLEIQVTELDINLGSNSEEDLMRQAIRYRQLMNIFRYCVDNGLANITNVTVWGLSDRDTWLNFRDGGGRKYPLLFDDYLYPKMAFWGFVLDESVPHW